MVDKGYQDLMDPKVIVDQKAIVEDKDKEELLDSKAILENKGHRGLVDLKVTVDRKVNEPGVQVCNGVHYNKKWAFMVILHQIRPFHNEINLIRTFIPQIN